MATTMAEHIQHVQELRRFLRDESLSSVVFHRLYETSRQGKSASQDKQKKKKPSKDGKDGKDKKKEKGDSEDQLDLQPPKIEIQNNASSFSVYTAIRQAILEQETLTRKFIQGKIGEINEETGEEKEKLENIFRLPKVVGFGLRSVFELIRETRNSHPSFCARALKALLDTLQGLAPEELASEPSDIMDPLFDLLLDLTTINSRTEDAAQLQSVSAACLISLIIARGETGKILAGISALLMHGHRMPDQTVEIPSNVIALQESIKAILVGKTTFPDWYNTGVPDGALLQSFPVQIKTTDQKDVGQGQKCAIASTGSYLYIHSNVGLFKIGSGYGNTLQGHIYAVNPSFYPDQCGWLVVIRGKLYFCPYSPRTTPTAAAGPSQHLKLLSVDLDTLQENGAIQTDFSHHEQLFSDGINLGCLSDGSAEEFSVSFYKVGSSSLIRAGEMTAQLTKKRLVMSDNLTPGMLKEDREKSGDTFNPILDDDVQYIGVGKEFTMCRTASGQLCFIGKGQALGMKEANVSKSNHHWVELSRGKAVSFEDCSIWHEGFPAVFLGNDRNTYLCLTQGGQQDQGEQGRRMIRGSKPIKVQGMEGKTPVKCACNNGTTAVVTKEGDLYLFGKLYPNKEDADPDQSPGLVTSLKGTKMVRVALGKSHGCAISSEGKVFTFGVNNKGQCGRGGPASDTEKDGEKVDMSLIDIEDDFEDEEKEKQVEPCDHDWIQSECMICIQCGECTGYGAHCINSTLPNRKPGTLCRCGAGDAGCSKCHICKTCAGELNVARDFGGVRINQAAIYNRGWLRPEDRAKGEDNNLSGDESKEVEKAVSKPPILTPEEIIVHRDQTVKAKEVSCGFHHTVILLENGEVYTFGSNSYGQLGLGDTGNRISPVNIPVAAKIKQVAAGSYHTLLLTENGNVLSFGRCQKGQLCRQVFEGTNNADAISHTTPAEVDNVGPEKGNKAVWISAAGDRSFIKVDEALVSPNMLDSATIFASKSVIGILPQDQGCSQHCMINNRISESCESFSGPEQVQFDGCCVCTDPVYDSILWSFDPKSNSVQCYNPLRASCGARLPLQDNISILGPELSLPCQSHVPVSIYQVALNVLSCLDTLSLSLVKGLTVENTHTQKEESPSETKVEDFSFAGRFEGYGGGWGYSGHSVEAIVFSTDTDVVVGGFGLFGGRGEYIARIKLMELGSTKLSIDMEGSLKAESEEKTYECGTKEEFPILFDEPIPITAGVFYLAWAKINGPSSDCGSGGQAIVTTDDKITFQFLSSRKSNNGTDVSAGQIPKIYYRLPHPEQEVTPQPKGTDFPLHILTSAFCCTVSPEAFESLLLLLQWAWVTFSEKMQQFSNLDKEEEQQPILKDLTRLSYICTACLRLTKSFVCDVFPNPATSKKVKPSNTNQLPQCISSTCKLLRNILEGSSQFAQRKKEKRLTPSAIILEEDIIDECQRTFIHCFHAFCPTSQLKWVFFCELLGQQEKEIAVNGSQTLLTAVLGALCDPSIKLTRVLPLLKVQEPDPYPFLKEKGNSDKTALEDSSPIGVDMDRGNLLTDLVSHIESSLKGEQQVAMNTSFQEILDQLLQILSVPIRTALEQKEELPVHSIQTNTSNFLVCVIGELASLATNCEAPYHSPSKPILATPSRYPRTNQSYNWSTCNGTPDAVCFSVNQSSVQIAGICVYTGLGQYNYELELLDGVEGAVDAHGPRWNSLEFARGVFSGEDAVEKLVEVKFDKPVSVKEGVKYAIRLRLHGGKTFSGEGGSAQVRCPDGVTFTFSNCTLSSNGTSLARGQIPQVLYYNNQSMENKNSLPEGSKSMEMEQQARVSLFTVTQAVVRQAIDVLTRALCFEESVVPQILQSSPLFSHLLPMTLAYIGPVAASHPKSSVQTLNFIRDILPQVATLNVMFSPQDTLHTQQSDFPAAQVKDGLEVTRSQRYLLVESDHPYQPATVCHSKVTFPPSVKWMTLEFGPECGTAQQEDSLQLYISAPLSHDSPGNNKPSVSVESEIPARYWPVMTKFHGRNNWPSSAVVLPGHEVIFSLCTASDYVKDKNANRFGFLCHVVGYEQDSLSDVGLVQLEKELCYLGGLCASALLHKDIPLSSFTADGEEDIEPIAEAAQEVFSAHAALLGKGFSLSQPLTIQQALKGHLPLQTQSNEKLFLQDFVQNVPETSGGRLASWFQPDSYVDPKHCEVILPKHGLSCGISSQLSILTRDQYGALVYVSGLKIEVEAVPSARNESSFRSSSAKKSDSSPSTKNTTFGGLPIPKTDTAYQPTLRRESSLYMSITMMKDYEQYSFEELRLAYMPSSRPTETVIVKDNQDGTYTASWTPGSIGVYSLVVRVDGYQVDGLPPVDVMEPPYGVYPSNTTPKKQEVKAKMRKFVAKHSSGLRIRTSPSLKSEQIGGVKVDGVIAFTEELQNGDGVWVRLTYDSIKKFCSENGHHQEGWCLQYNQHIGKTLLVPLEEPKSLFKEVPKKGEEEEVEEPAPTAETLETIVGGPGFYHVINCGPSGHNIRCKASLKASAIGMMVSGDILKVVADKEGSDGALWVQLDKESISQYCEGKHAEAWALAASNGQVYLSIKEEGDPAEGLSTGEGGATYSAGASGRRKSSSGQGFNFKNTQGPPQMEFASNGEVPFFGDGKDPLLLEEYRSKQVPPPRAQNGPHSDDTLPSTSTSDSSQSTPSKNGTKHTSPQKFVSKSQFTIGSGEGSPKSGLSPKLSRRPRSGGRRSRSASPGGKEHSPSHAKVTPPPPRQESKESFKPALATSVCECARAVFAAFLWHEGLVHDAMACASFLKFNVNITKAVAFDVGEDPPQAGKRELKLKNRHSMDLSKARRENEFPLDIVALNINENGAMLRKRLEQELGEKDAYSEEDGEESRDGPASGMGLGESDQDLAKSLPARPPAITVPITLKNLLSLWDDISVATINIASQSLVLPSPAPIIKTASTKSVEVKEIPRPREPKGKKRRDRPSKGGRGNLFGDAAGAPIGVEKNETICELCVGVFPRPVTYHMKNAHPGCGRNANGYGYNSSGTYCGGWAGNCGDGGMAGSSWYLMCRNCKSKYIQDRQDKAKDKDKVKKMKKKMPPLKTPKVIPPLEAHHVMKANALFLLDLASACGPSFSRKCSAMKMRRFDMPAVRETDSMTPENPFPIVQFQYLKNSPLSPEELDMGSMVQENDYGIPVPSRSVPALNLSVTNNDEVLKSNSQRKSNYLRSVSMLAQDGYKGLKLRRRNLSGSADDGSSLLRRPSPRLATLMEDGSTAALALSRPSMRFMVRHHDLEGLKLAMKQSLCKAACKIHALQALNWLLRSATQPICIHDLLWHFVGALSPIAVEKEVEEEEKGKDGKKEAKEEAPPEPEKDQEGLILEHPLEDILVSEEAVSLLPITFHDFLQTVSDLMLVLPHGGALQRMALQCWSMKFRTNDHMFLHQSHVFSNINRILSKSDEAEADQDQKVVKRDEEACAQLEYLVDITNSIECEVSSRSVMLGCLTDGSTETFWESGDEDRNKPKVITIKVKDASTPSMLAVHIDNSRDLRNKVNLVTLGAGAHSSSLQKMKQVSLDMRFGGWVTFDLEELPNSKKVMTIDVKGPDSHLRVRQIKVLGVREGEQFQEPLDSDPSLQQMDCISESLRIFRLLTSQVFGKLLAGEVPGLDGKETPEGKSGSEDGDAGDPDLREHMVGILFSRSRLTNLQKQVCSHIVLAIHKETSRMREYWEGNLLTDEGADQVHKAEGVPPATTMSDAYCFELLSMVLALSYSGVGRAYVAQQTELLQDLLSLLHTSTPRVQRQVTSILRKVLPEISPAYFASVVGVSALPPTDVVPVTPEGQSSPLSTPQKGVLDIFLACIAKALTVQVKAKGIGGSKAPQMTSLASTFSQQQKEKLDKDSSNEVPSEAPEAPSTDHWYLRGTMPFSLAEQMINLIKDMSKGELSIPWTDVTKSAIAEVVLSLTRIPETVRKPVSCLQESTLWLSLASLCVLEPEHVDRLSTSQRTQNVEKTPSKEKPTCENHDDALTLAIIECGACGTLCAECDRILHLPKSKRHHQRKVFKEEEDSIKVDLHEGCGRSKLYWITALADSKTLKAMVEFKQTSAENIGVSGSHGVCRFCGNAAAVGLGRAGNVCLDPECKKHSSNICSKSLPCGHLCGGIRDESTCLPCLHGCSKDQSLKQDAEDMCMICFTEALSCAPAVQLDCGHVFHQNCCKVVLEKRWVGPRITFGFTLCPICKASINHKSLQEDLAPIQTLEADVRRKALMRLEYEGLDKCEAVTTPGARYHNNPAGFAMNRYAYYVCFKCSKAYYGGEARCDQDAAAAGYGDFNPAELICGGCSDVARAQLCPKHGTDYLEYKCRYCCSVAVYFCFGSTHFCNPCHDNFQWITSMSKTELPHCPAGPGAIQLEGEECPLHVEHPATGEEYALGCGICRNTHTF